MAQFLYCIPLATVERVLTWLRPLVPPDEQAQLLRQLQQVIPDQLLLQLVVAWLQPSAPGAANGTAKAGVELYPINHLAGSPGPPSACTAAWRSEDASPPCPTAVNGPGTSSAAAAGAGAAAAAVSSGGGGSSQWPPLHSIKLFHSSIMSALDSFVREANALRQQSEVPAADLQSLVERHRWGGVRVKGLGLGYVPACSFWWRGTCGLG